MLQTTNKNHTNQFLNQDSSKINKIAKIFFCGCYAELVSESPAVTVETLKQVQGDGKKNPGNLENPAKIPVQKFKNIIAAAMMMMLLMLAMPTVVSAQEVIVDIGTLLGADQSGTGWNYTASVNTLSITGTVTITGTTSTVRIGANSGTPNITLRNLNITIAATALHISNNTTITLVGTNNLTSTGNNCITVMGVTLTINGDGVLIVHSESSDGILSIAGTINVNGGTVIATTNNVNAHGINLQNVFILNTSDGSTVFASSINGAGGNRQGTVLTYRITTQPANQTVNAGETATFGFGSEGNATPSIQWQVSTDDGVSWSNISGANTAPLNLTNVSPIMNNNMYRAVATNTVGGQLVTTTSNSALLTVLPHTGPVLTVKVSGSGGFRFGSSGDIYRNEPEGIEGYYAAGADVVLEFIPDAGSVIRRITRSDVGNIGPNLNLVDNVRRYVFAITDDTVIEVHFGTPHPGLTIKGDLIIHSGTAIFETKEY